MQALVLLVQLELGVLVSVLAALIAYRILIGRIRTAGLLYEKTATGLGGFSAMRLQLLLMTIAGACYVFFQVVTNAQAGRNDFPDLPTNWLLALGGSHSLYLGRKLYTLFRGLD